MRSSEDRRIASQTRELLNSGGQLLCRLMVRVEAHDSAHLTPDHQNHRFGVEE
jgi:hypothetical protein